MFNVFKSPYLEEDDGVNIGGGSEAPEVESAEEVVTPDTEAVTDDAEGGKDTTNSQAEAKPTQNHETNEQFKAARIEAERKAQARQDNFAKSRGFTNFDEMEAVAKQQDLVDKGYSSEEAVRMQRLENLETSLNQGRIDGEKEKLKTEPFFNEIEPLLDATLKQNPSLNVEDVYGWIYQKNRKQFNERLKAQEAKAAAQRTLNNVNGKAHIKPDGGGTEIETMTVDDSEWKQVQTLNPGTKKEDYIKFKKSLKGA